MYIGGRKMQIIQKIAHRSNYGLIRSLDTIKFIIIHYTANDGDKSFNNANYFQTHTNLKASAHYFADDTTIYQSVPDNYIAYSVGGSKWNDCSKTGGGRLYRVANNTNSINIELCDTNKNGEYDVTQATITLALELTRSLMKKYNISSENVIRHFDVNGKHCPAYWMDNTKWENEFHSKLTSNTVASSTSNVIFRVRKSWNDSASQLGAFSNLENAKTIADKNPGYTVYDTNGKVVYSRSKQTYSGGFPILPPVLKKGSRGSQVLRLQKFLNWYGSYGLVVDSDFGTKTKNALQDFQKKEKLVVDGIFGNNSLAKAKSVKK